MSNIGKGNSYDFVNILKTFAQECFDDDLGLTLTFLARLNLLSTHLFCKSSFILQEFMELVEEVCAQVNNTIK